MQNFVSVYEDNATIIQKFIMASLRAVDLKKFSTECNQKLFDKFPSLELIYLCDESFVQSSPNYYPDKNDEKQIGIDRSYLIHKKMGADAITFLNPYISIGTGNLCITAIAKIEEHYILFDFDLKMLLQRFDLIEQNTNFRLMTRLSYGVIGNGLLFFGLFIVLYGFYTFFQSVTGDVAMNLDVVFKPVIALTLGLAVYDLGKTIVEQEVLPQTKSISKRFSPMTLMNFSTSIIIALLIEALLVVFKISITDYKDLPYASGLIASLAALLLVFALFVYLIRKSDVKREDED
jgi:hypothetical protein